MIVGNHQGGVSKTTATVPIPTGLPALPPARKRCDANALRGTGTGVCDRILDERGQCPGASQHVSDGL